jgi:predicted porin
VTTTEGTLQAHEQVYSLGYRYDKMNIVSWGEYVYTHSGDGTSFPTANFAQSGKAGYVLIGYRVGDWLPRYTFAQASVTNIIDAGKTTTHTIGVNYQASAKVVAKAEFEIDKGGTPVPFEDTISPLTSSTTGTAGYVGVDFVF